MTENGARPIADVATELGIHADHVHSYGGRFAKVDLAALDQPRLRTGVGKLVLVSAMTPTKAGEGKTTTSIGLSDGLRQLGQSVCVALREPSLGPCMGIKGGGTGGGQAQLVPSNQINLHFTGDFHAIAAAHNLVAAVLDNHIHFGSPLRIDSRRTLWPRAIDMNDRALRNLVAGLGARTDGHPRETGFVITAASELMAILCLATDVQDLRSRVGRIVVALDHDRKPVTVNDMNITGAVVALMHDALAPNLAQTREGTPALVHGGPFANIAHGCSSILATKLGLHLADWVVTEAGFGSDLGAEKFFNIKCRAGELNPSAVVVVATVRALKLHGGQQYDDLDTPNVDATTRGLPNLAKHVHNVSHFSKPAIVALNRFATDSDAEIAAVRDYCHREQIAFSIATHFEQGGAGAVEVARAVIEQCSAAPTPYRPLYPVEQAIADKIRTIAQRMYGARDIVITKQATRDISAIEQLGATNLPVCIAKTHSSLSDDPKRLGCPQDFDVTVRRIQPNIGAGFLVVLTGDVVRMPGLPRVPQAEAIDVEDGHIVGIR